MSFYSSRKRNSVHILYCWWNKREFYRTFWKKERSLWHTMWSKEMISDSLRNSYDIHYETHHTSFSTTRIKWSGNEAHLSKIKLSNFSFVFSCFTKILYEGKYSNNRALFIFSKKIWNFKNDVSTEKHTLNLHCCIVLWCKHLVKCVMGKTIYAWLYVNKE